MSHYCWICRSFKANEKFSGKGHRAHICKQCSLLPLSERNKIDHSNEIFGYWNQKKMSQKNIDRLKELMESEDPEIVELASVVLVVAEKFPGKRARILRIAKEDSNLISRLENVNLISEWSESYDDSFDDL